MTMFERIKEIAKNQGLSLNQLNDKAGFKPNVIYSWKTKNPSIERVQKIADVLHVSLAELVDDPVSTQKQPAKQRTSDLLAAHIDDDATPDQVQDIIDYIEFKKRQIDKEKGN